MILPKRARGGIGPERVSYPCRRSLFQLLYSNVFSLPNQVWIQILLYFAVWALLLTYAVYYIWWKFEDVWKTPDEVVQVHACPNIPGS